MIEALTELDPYSAGPDEDIPARILTSCKDQLALPLTLFWTESFEQGYIPEVLKTQFITPIFKKGDRTDPANYRPVSITSHVMKTFERVVRKHLVKHLEDNELLSNNQHGFRKKKSCMTQLLSHIEHIYKSLNHDDEVDVIYLDFAKAFDKVDHAILLSKLEQYGIKGKALAWIKEFLLERKQAVTIEGHKSSFQEVISGVPQGTVLGPLMFLIYINDIANNISPGTHIRLFADDCVLYRVIQSLQDTGILQKDLTSLTDWSTTWQMSFNTAKLDSGVEKKGFCFTPH